MKNILKLNSDPSSYAVTERIKMASPPSMESHKGDPFRRGLPFHVGSDAPCSRPGSADMTSHNLTLHHITYTYLCAHAHTYTHTHSHTYRYISY